MNSDLATRRAVQPVAICIVWAVFLCTGTTACAQEVPLPVPVSAESDDGEEYQTDPFQRDLLLPVEQAFDNLEAHYANGGPRGFQPEQSIIAFADSARHYSRTLRLARLFAAEEGADGGGYATSLLIALEAMGAQRPFFRALAFDAANDVGMAAAAIGVLAGDPRASEYAEIQAVGRSIGDETGYGPLSNIISVYGSSLSAAEDYDAISTFEGRLSYLGAAGAQGDMARFRALYRERPTQVEAWILQQTFPPAEPGDLSNPPDSLLHRRLQTIARASDRFVLPIEIEGPMLPTYSLAPLCAGRPATVYVEAGRVVGGPLAGTLFAGRLVGTTGPDVIVGTDAADAITALAGDDTLCGGTGDDALHAGDGTDTTDGGPGADGCDAAETPTACEAAIAALTDVRPVLECVTQATPGGPLTAYFGYENRNLRAGRVPYGSNNRLTPAGYDRAQPDLFGLPNVVAGRPGRSPFYPGHAFTVTFQPGQNVVWKLFTRTSTASSGSTRCPAP